MTATSLHTACQQSGYCWTPYFARLFHSNLIELASPAAPVVKTSSVAPCEYSQRYQPLIEQ